ncbi:Uncharacterised protein [Chlamydia abortus]|uniref:DUF6483 family protein n=1 Tax=Paenibacillus residui TaxID=629724 RepID=A0ABW3D522_9BACL|nr:Uncharacterised protein [Chlamydia abortus]
MYHRDYLMRLIGQMTQMLGRMAGLRKEQKHEQAEAIMEEWLGRSLGMSLKLIRALSYQDLIRLLTSGNGTDTDKLLIVARVLREDGELTESRYGRDAAYPLYVKSLMLLLAARRLGITHCDYMDLAEETDGLLGRLDSYSLEEDCLQAICLYYEQTGRYSRAEDRLFEWLENAAMDQAKAIRFGKAMYERLLELPDDALQQGDLPREEVLEAVRELQAIEEQRQGENVVSVAPASCSQSDRHSGANDHD